MYLFHSPLDGFVNDQVCDIMLSTQLCTSADLFYRITVCSHICTDPVSGGSNYANVVIVRWIMRWTIKVCHIGCISPTVWRQVAVIPRVAVIPALLILLSCYKTRCIRGRGDIDIRHVRLGLPSPCSKLDQTRPYRPSQVAHCSRLAGLKCLACATRRHQAKTKTLSSPSAPPLCTRVCLSPPLRFGATPLGPEWQP